MKKFTCLAGCLLLTVFGLMAQDEGVIQKRDRIDKNKGIFLGFGPSVTLGKNIGDYNAGFNIEAGFQKRLNRILSVGPSVSYLKFKYDPEVTNAERGAYYGNGDIPIAWYSEFDTWGDKYPTTQGQTYDYGYVLALKGGDISLISLALNLKLNFVPITDKTKFSVYGFAKPFVTIAQRSSVSGTGTRYVWESYEDDKGTTTENDDELFFYQGDDTWYPDGYVEQWSAQQYPVLAEESTVTGGIFVGPGVEFLPSNSVSFFLQVAFGYTFPVSYVSTKSYDDSIDSYLNEEFPIVKKGFPSLNLQFGVSFNF